MTPSRGAVSSDGAPPANLPPVNVRGTRGGSAAIAMVCLLALAVCRSVLGLEELIAGAEPGGAPDAGDAGGDGGTVLDAGDAGATARPARREIVVEGEPAPTDLALLGDRLVWIRSGSLGNVVAAPLSGGPIEVGNPSPMVNPRELVVAGGFPYAVVESSRVQRFFPPSSCEQGEQVARLATFGSDLLVVTTGGALWSGTCVDRSLELASSVVVASGDAPYAWFATTTGAIERAQWNPANGQIDTLPFASGQADVAAITHSATHVAWVRPTTTSGVAAAIWSRAKAAGGATAATPATLVAELGEIPKALVGAGDRVYWTEAKSGRVLSAPTGGGEAPAVIAEGLDRPWGLVVITDDDIFVTESGGGRVIRIRR